MAHLIHQRCLNHSLREAVARCPECGRFFCRECITEHEGRVLCAACLRQRVQPRFTRRRGLVWAWRSVQFLAGLFTVWLFFYLLGGQLLSIDSAVHEGTVWRDLWPGE